MPASSSPPNPDGSPLSEDDRRALVRFLEQSLDHGFRLAIVEAVNHADREAILAIAAATIGPGLVRVAVDELPGSETNLWSALREPFAAHSPRGLAVWGFENGSQADWPGQLNVQRDLFVRDFAVPWLLFIHPASRVPLLQAAPDFCDFAVLWLREELPAAEMELSASVHTMDSLLLPRDVVVHNALLQQSQDALEAGRYDAAGDLLARFDLQPDHDSFNRVVRQLLGARLERVKGHLGAAEAILRNVRSSIARQPMSSGIQVLVHTIDSELGLILHQSGRYDEAEALFRRSLAVTEDMLGHRHPAYSATLYNLSCVLSAQGEYVEAERLLRDVLALGSMTPESESTLRGAALSALAGMLSERGEYIEAERLLGEALAIKEKSRGREHPEYGASLNELAGVFARQGKHGEAERLFREALANGERALGRQHPSYSAALHNLATVLAQQGNAHEAERLLRETIAIEAKALGREHPQYSTSLHSLATVLAQQGKLTEAERLLRESLAIDEKVLGRQHPSFGASLHSLACMLSRQGKFVEAERLFHESIAVKEKALGLEHIDLFRTLAELALVVAGQGRILDSVLYAERALRIGRASLGVDDDEVRSMQKFLQKLRAL